MNRFNRQKIHHHIYLFGLALMITSLPLSIYLTSIAQFVLVINWLAEGNFRIKSKMIWQNKTILLFSSVFIWYLAGYFYSADTSSALFHLKNALPLLVLPIIIGTSRPTGTLNMNRLLLLFCAGVIAASVACVINYLLNGLPPGGDFRDISIILPHLRFSILIVMAVMILAGFIWIDPPANGYMNSVLMKITFFALAVFLVLFLLFLRSATGILLLIISAAAFTLYVSFTFSGIKVRILLVLFVSATVTFLTAITAYSWFTNFHAPKIDFSSLDTQTANGNPYFHDTCSQALENGNYTGLYLCESELQREWDRLSHIFYDSLDAKKQPVKSTLMRYLTSKGLRKDSVSVHLLTNEDIAKIEDGLANYKFKNDPGINQRLYETLYEIHIYKTTGFVEQHSFGQRLAFAEESLGLILENPVTGIGTGDVHNELLQKLKQENIDIDKKWKGKPHNQYLFYLIAFGIAGFMWIMFCWIYPAIKLRAGILFVIFSLIMLISMMSMDTHEAYNTMAFFALFYSLLVFGKERNEDLFKPE